MEWVEDYPGDEVTDVVRIGTILRRLIMEREVGVQCAGNRGRVMD